MQRTLCEAGHAAAVMSDHPIRNRQPRGFAPEVISESRKESARALAERCEAHATLVSIQFSWGRGLAAWQQRKRKLVFVIGSTAWRCDQTVPQVKGPSYLQPPSAVAGLRLDRQQGLNTDGCRRLLAFRRGARLEEYKLLLFLPIKRFLYICFSSTSITPSALKHEIHTISLISRSSLMDPVVPQEVTTELTQILSNLVLGDNQIRSKYGSYETLRTRL